MPPDMLVLLRAFAGHDYFLTEHASDRAVARGIDSHEIEDAVLSGVLLEDYPNDKYGPSCLLMGRTRRGRPLHVQVSYPPQVKVITVYEPSSSEWHDDYSRRRTR